jgi:hypothetical protein
MTLEQVTEPFSGDREAMFLWGPTAEEERIRGNIF